jgi:hypothetical protein
VARKFAAVHPDTDGDEPPETPESGKEVDPDG